MIRFQRHRPFIIISWPCRHDWHILLNTIDEFGGEYICHKCFTKEFSAWTTPMQVLRAKVYMSVRDSTKRLKDSGLI